MQCVILAGGLGTRIRSVESRKPKTMIEIAGKPFAAWQLEWLRKLGVSSVVYCIGHLGDQIKEFVGDGSKWNIEVTYVDEGAELRGTGGALRLASSAGVLKTEFFVLYGDSYLQVPSLEEIQEAGKSSGLPALMTVFRNRGLWDQSNTEYRSGRVTQYSKHSGSAEDFEYIDYGLSWFKRDLIEAEIPVGEPYDLSLLMEKLSRGRRLAGFEVSERFFEIGSPEGFLELSSLLSKN
jgi:NDP-sugar pyrophosphorylase family protein